MTKKLVGAYFQLVGDKRNKQQNQWVNAYVASLSLLVFRKQEI